MTWNDKTEARAEAVLAGPPPAMATLERELLAAALEELKAQRLRADAALRELGWAQRSAKLLGHAYAHDSRPEATALAYAMSIPVATPALDVMPNVGALQQRIDDLEDRIGAAQDTLRDLARNANRRGELHAPCGEAFEAIADFLVSRKDVRCSHIDLSGPGPDYFGCCRPAGHDGPHRDGPGYQPDGRSPSP